MSNLRKKTATGFVYSVMERAGAQGINFVLSLLLARILSPDEYGTIALVMVLITFCDVFATYGFGNSLVVQKDSDQIDFSTCFYFGLVLSAIIYVVIYFAAPAIAAFYKIDILVPVLRVMGFRVPLAAVNSVQHAYVSKHMEFKKFFYSTLIGTVVAGIAALVMALSGWGIWALVAQYLGRALIATVSLWFIAKWRPILAFSWGKLKRIYQYGWKILAVGLIDTGYTELRSLIIARRYTNVDLAYYSKGNNFPTFCMKLVTPSISKVLFASLSHCNEKKDEMRDITRKFTQLSTYLIFPILIGLAVVAEPLIVVLLTEKWLPCVIFLQLGCVADLFRPLRFIGNSVIKASGRSDLLLKLDIVKKVIGVVLLVGSMHFGVVGIAISLVISNAIAAIINFFPMRKILDYSFFAQVWDFLSNLVISCLMGCAVLTLSVLPIAPFALLVIQISVGVLFYVALSALTKNKSFLYILTFLKKKARRGR